VPTNRAPTTAKAQHLQGPFCGQSIECVRKKSPFFQWDEVQYHKSSLFIFYFIKVLRNYSFREVVENQLCLKDGKTNGA